MPSAATTTWLARSTRGKAPGGAPAGSKDQVHSLLLGYGGGDVSGVDRFISDPYLDPSDDTLIDNALTVMREQGLDLVALGLDRDELRRRIVAARAAAGPQQPMRLPVQPQVHRQEMRVRLREQTQSAANRICEALSQRIGGHRIAALGGTGAANNLGAVMVLMHRAVNAYLGIDSGQRRELSVDELERVLPRLDNIADEVEADLRERLGG